MNEYFYLAEEMSFLSAIFQFKSARCFYESQATFLIFGWIFKRRFCGHVCRAPKYRVALNFSSLVFLPNYFSTCPQIFLTCYSVRKSIVKLFLLRLFQFFKVKLLKMLLVPE